MHRPFSSHISLDGSLSGTLQFYSENQQDLSPDHLNFLVPVPIFRALNKRKATAKITSPTPIQS
jgi:hypothetical protein